MKRIFLYVVIAVFGIAVKSNAQVVAQQQISSISNPLDKVLKLEPITFSYDQNWVDKLKLTTNSQSGFNMEVVKNATPELLINLQKNYQAGKNNSKYATIQKVDYEVLIPLLVGSIKEQQLQIEALKSEINLLKSKAHSK